MSSADLDQSPVDIVAEPSAFREVVLTVLAEGEGFNWWRRRIAQVIVERGGQPRAIVPEPQRTR